MSGQNNIQHPCPNQEPFPKAQPQETFSFQFVQYQYTEITKHTVSSCCALITTRSPQPKYTTQQSLALSLSGIQIKPSATEQPRQLLSQNPLEMCRHLRLYSSGRLIGKDRKLMDSLGVAIVAGMPSFISLRYHGGGHSRLWSANKPKSNICGGKCMSGISNVVIFSRSVAQFSCSIHRVRNRY